MNGLVLRALRAAHGDSLLLFADGATVLIDGGPPGVYQTVLREQLAQLEVADGDSPLIDLLMVSHIDADHIAGILDLTAELLEAQEDDRALPVRVREAWHNSFADMIAQTGAETAGTVEKSSVQVADTLGSLPALHFDPHDSKLVLSSVGQGRRLRLDLEALNIDLNRRFEDNVVLQSTARGPWSTGELELNVIGPTRIELEKLRKEWAKQVKKILAKEAASPASAAKLDRSVSNLASIVAIAKAGGGSVLLTGDARGDMIIEWLESAGHLEPGGTIHFDIVKMPHHGSDRNVSPAFFERIVADHYVFCGDGGHGNPEPKTFEMLFAARPALDYTVHLTYDLDELKANSKFKKAGNVAPLDAVFQDPARKAILNSPGPDDMYIDIPAGSTVSDYNRP